MAQGNGSRWTIPRRTLVVGAWLWLQAQSPVLGEVGDVGGMWLSRIGEHPTLEQSSFLGRLWSSSAVPTFCNPGNGGLKGSDVSALSISLVVLTPSPHVYPGGIGKGVNERMLKTRGPERNLDSTLSESGVSGA